MAKGVGRQQHVFYFLFWILWHEADDVFYVLFWFLWHKAGDVFNFSSDSSSMSLVKFFFSCFLWNEWNEDGVDKVCHEIN